MSEFKYRVTLETVRHYDVTVLADSEEKACEIMDNECWGWDDWGMGNDVILTSNPHVENKTEYTLKTDESIHPGHEPQMGTYDH